MNIYEKRIPSTVKSDLGYQGGVWDSDVGIIGRYGMGSVIR